jgi:methylmalonyl-CoA mutase N-terminal domain/subunit
MYKKKVLDDIERRKKQWEEKFLKPALQKAGLKEPPNRVYTPLDIKKFDFLEKVGFPCEYPYATLASPFRINSDVEEVVQRLEPSKGTSQFAGGYAGYGTAEDTRGIWVRDHGLRVIPAFDMPTQVGRDSDDPLARGEVGKVGVAIDTLRDFEVLYSAFDGWATLDQVFSFWTINAPANILLALAIALAEKKGIPISKLRLGLQNDTLKEYVARGMYIWPIEPQMRMHRDTIVFGCKHMPLLNIMNFCAYHIQEAGATPAQATGLAFAHGIAYMQLGIDAGLDIDEFAPQITLHPPAGSMDFYTEIARARAARRIWVKIMKDRFGAKNPSSWLGSINDLARVGRICMTNERPLNNLIRSVLGGVASALSGARIWGGVPYDEPLGLGHSYEAQQLSLDATRIMRYEAKLEQAIDPFAGSYFMEYLTDKLEAEIWDVINKVEAQGGAVQAIKSGWTQREISRSAYEAQRDVERGEKVIVGVNRFIGENELDVRPSRLVPSMYDPVARETAEERQIANLQRVKAERSSSAVQAALAKLRNDAKNDEVNIIPALVECAKSYASVGEMCSVLRDEWGEYEDVPRI